MTANSVSNQIKLSMLDLNAQIMQGTYGSASQINNTQNNKNTLLTNSITFQNKNIYAVKGDSKYKEEFDNNNDGIITFNEYVKYISEQKLADNSAVKNLARYTKTSDTDSDSEKVIIQNIGKIMNRYLNNYIKLPTSIIETEV